jgi:hypothetical protein
MIVVTLGDTVNCVDGIVVVNIVVVVVIVTQTAALASHMHFCEQFGEFAISYMVIVANQQPQCQWLTIQLPRETFDSTRLQSN